MPTEPLTQSDLENYRTNLSDATKSLPEKLRALELLHTNFMVNERRLIRYEYGLELLSTERLYSEKKRLFQAKISDLKKQFKQIDNRITAAEQKLSHGIPDDLELMDKLIAEQEAIVGEQEKLNAMESSLTEEIRMADVAHGKILEKLDQKNINALEPLEARSENYASHIEKSGKNIQFRARIISVAFCTGIPILLDILAKQAGMGSGKNFGVGHSLFGHYIFLVSLVLAQLFFAERIQNSISGFLSTGLIKGSLSELDRLLAENSRKILVLETKHGTPIDRVIKTMNSAESHRD